MLAHIEPGEASEGIGVFQMESEFFVGKFAVLLEDCRTEHLLAVMPFLPVSVRWVVVRSLKTRSSTVGVASRIVDICSSSFTIELRAMGEKRFIWGVNFWRILESLQELFGNDYGILYSLSYHITPNNSRGK
jgi:hypothetical protein